VIELMKSLATKRGERSLVVREIGRKLISANRRQEGETWRRKTWKPCSTLYHPAA